MLRGLIAVLSARLVAGLSQVDLSSSAVSCKGEGGHDVDFGYSFKYPGGWKYASMGPGESLAEASGELTAKTSGVVATLAQLSSAGVSSVHWNDQPPGKGDSSAPYAHAKGVLGFNSEGGFWLTHSLPHFPETSMRSLFSDASDDFGQSFLCITLTAAEIQKVASVLLITRPTVYDSSFHKGAAAAYSALADVVAKKWEKSTMTTDVSIKSKGGQTFTFFGKSGLWGKGKDLYHDLVVPKVGPLEMEGWRRGRGVWDAACSKDQVLDVLSVAFPSQDWITGDDHSKWAVTQKGTAFCVGDLNRADGQDLRGGGTVCIHDSTFAKAMRKVVKTTDKCSRTIDDIMV